MAKKAADKDDELAAKEALKVARVAAADKRRVDEAARAAAKAASKVAK